MKLEPANIVCPKCGNGNYMRHLIGKGVGKLDMKCINCKMADRLTRWEGRREDGTRKAVLVKHDGLFPEIYQEALQKLARYEDAEEGGFLHLPPEPITVKEARLRALIREKQLDMAENMRLRRMVDSLEEQL